jgi:RNA polymerase sigma-70 factor (ECF subfamily)
VSDKDDRPGERPEWACTTSYQMLADARKGNRDAWERLVRLYAPLVLYWCRRRLRGPLSQDAPDLVQKVFMTVSRRIATFSRRGRGAFHGWLRRIFERRIKEYWREYWLRHPNVTIDPATLEDLPAPKGSSNPDGSADMDDPPTTNDSSDPGGGLVILLRRLLELIRHKFEDRTFEAFWKVAIDGRPPNDVADELGMTRNNVDQANFRVRKCLKQEVEALGLTLVKGKIVAADRVAVTQSEVTS